MYLLTFHKLIWSVDGSISNAPVSSFGHKLPSPLSWNPTGKWIRYKSTYSTCRAVSDSVKNFSTDSARFPINGSWKWKLPFIYHTQHYIPYDITVWCLCTLPSVLLLLHWINNYMISDLNWCTLFINTLSCITLQTSVVTSKFHASTMFVTFNIAELFHTKYL